MEIYAVKITGDIDECIFKDVLSNLDDDKKKRITKAYFIDDKFRLMLAEVLIRLIIIKKLGLQNNSIIFKRGQNGKPYLENNLNFNFNISHSGHWVICAISDIAIGIDIEEIQSIEFKDIAHRFFSQKETSFILNSDEAVRLKNFYRIWTLKESYIKADGRGLALPLKAFTIDITSDDNCKTMDVGLNKKFYFKEFDIDCNYTMAACSRDNGFPEEISFINQNELINEFLNFNNYNF